mmetsp:Transcript_4770/g.8172  ORF Transcript_4770/g.8172 Transcript_4770/m.8172 type:complete len:115 (+) Transcript_4770:1628-1972(+)
MTEDNFQSAVGSPPNGSPKHSPESGRPSSVSDFYNALKQRQSIASGPQSNLNGVPEAGIGSLATNKGINFDLSNQNKAIKAAGMREALGDNVEQEASKQPLKQSFRYDDDVKRE